MPSTVMWPGSFASDFDGGRIRQFDRQAFGERAEVVYDELWGASEVAETGDPSNLVLLVDITR